MANYNNLKAGIDAVIKTNGRQEISGAALNTQLKNMITELGAGYQYMGVATPSGNPGTPDQRVLYFAYESGTYTNFGNKVIPPATFGILTYDGTWALQLVNDCNFQAFCNVFSGKDIKSRAAISAGTGAFRSASSEYKRVSFYLPERVTLYVGVTTSGSQECFWKYTDDTYATPERRILSAPYYGKVTLDAGYYAFSWQSDNLSATPNPGEVVLARIDMLERIVNGIIANYDQPDVAPLLSVMPSLFGENGDFSKWVDFPNEGFVYSSGQPGGYNDEYRYTNYMRIAPYQKFSVSDFYGSASVSKVTFYDKDKNVLYTYVTNSTEFDVVAPAGAYYVIFCAEMYSGGSLIRTPKIVATGELETYKSQSQFKTPFRGVLEKGKYIADNTGIIGIASLDYRLVKFRVQNESDYFIYAYGHNIHPMLWEYSDDTYETPVRQVLGASLNIPFCQTIRLTPGYYAFCYSNVDAGSPQYPVGNGEYCIFDAKYFYEQVSRNIDVTAIQQYDFASLGNNALTLTGNAYRDGDDVIVFGSNLNRAYLGGGFEGQHYTMQAKVVMSDGISFVMGKDGSSFGAFIEFLSDKIVLHNNPGYQGGHTADYPLGFTLNVGEEYLFKIQFDVTSVKRFKVVVIGQYNEYFEQELEETINGYGRPFYYSNATARVKEFSLSIQEFYDTRNIKASVWGHSFVEGDSLGQDRIYSFTNLLANAIGANIVTNFGLGGDTIPGMLEKMPNNLPLVMTAKYGLMFIGTNDGSSSAQMIAGLQSAIALLESYGMTPILSTIAPKATGFTTAHRETNAWIRSSGYNYVDMEQVFLSRPATAQDLTIADIKTNLFLGDGVHPTILGHRFIFNRIQMDCPFIF